MPGVSRTLRGHVKSLARDFTRLREKVADPERENVVSARDNAPRLRDMKGPDERGLTAQRLRDVRIAAGFSNQKKAAAHVREVTRVVGLTDSQWASYEAGDPRRPFQAKHREAIEAVFGPLGDDRPDPVIAPTPDLADLLKALTEQARQQAQLIGLLTEQNAMLMRLLGPAGDTSEESELTSIGHGAARLARVETVGEAGQAPPVELRPGSAPRTPPARKQP